MNKKQNIVILSCGLNLLHDFMHELKPIKPIFSLILLLYGKEIKKIKYPKQICLIFQANSLNIEGKWIGYYYRMTSDVNLDNI